MVKQLSTAGQISEEQAAFKQSCHDWSYCSIKSKIWRQCVTCRKFSQWPEKGLQLYGRTWRHSTAEPLEAYNIPVVKVFIPKPSAGSMWMFFESAICRRFPKMFNQPTKPKDLFWSTNGGESCKTKKEFIKFTKKMKNYSQKRNEVDSGLCCVENKELFCAAGWSLLRGNCTQWL